MVTPDQYHELLFLGTVSYVFKDGSVSILKHDKERLTTIYAGKVRVRFRVGNFINIWIPAHAGKSAFYCIEEERLGEFAATVTNFSEGATPVVGSHVYLALPTDIMPNGEPKDGQV